MAGGERAVVAAVGAPLGDSVFECLGDTDCQSRTEGGAGDVVPYVDVTGVDGG